MKPPERNVANRRLPFRFISSFPAAHVKLPVCHALVASKRENERELRRRVQSSFATSRAKRHHHQKHLFAYNILLMQPAGFWEVWVKIEFRVRGLEHGTKGEGVPFVWCHGLVLGSMESIHQTIRAVNWLLPSFSDTTVAAQKVLWMDEILHHVNRRVIVRGCLGCCEMDFVHPQHHPLP